MGTYTHANFITYLTLSLGQRDDITAYDDLWINAAYYWLTSRKDLYFPELEWLPATSADTTDGTAYIDTTSSMLFVQGVYDSTSTHWLEKIRPHKYFAYPDRSDSSAEGEPTRWTHTAGGTNRGYIYLYPTPDDTYAIIRYYRGLPTALTGSNKTVIGTEWDEIILEKAIWFGKKRLREYAGNPQQQNIDNQLIEDMIDDIKGLYDRENIHMKEGVIMDPAYLQKGC